MKSVRSGLLQRYQPHRRVYCRILDDYHVIEAPVIHAAGSYSHHRSPPLGLKSETYGGDATPIQSAFLWVHDLEI